MYAVAVDASAGGAFLSGAGTRLLAGASLRAGADAATATIRETDGSGTGYRDRRFTSLCSERTRKSRAGR